MKLWDEEASPPDFEPLEIDSLEKYKLMSRMLDVVGSGEDISALYELEKAEGRLPPGNLGEVWFGEAEREVIADFSINGRGLLVEPSGESLVFEEKFDGLLFRGEVPPLQEIVSTCFSVVPRSSMEKTVLVCGLSICAVVPQPGTEPFESLVVCQLDKKYLHAKSDSPRTRQEC